MIHIYFNSRLMQLEQRMTLAEILHNNGLNHGCFAVAINRIFVPRNQYSVIEPNNGDHIEIVTPMQGG